VAETSQKVMETIVAMVTAPDFVVEINRGTSAASFAAPRHRAIFVPS
jgi:hypothetical protein